MEILFRAISHRDQLRGGINGIWMRSVCSTRNNEAFPYPSPTRGE